MAFRSRLRRSAGVFRPCFHLPCEPFGNKFVMLYLHHQHLWSEWESCKTLANQSPEQSPTPHAGGNGSGRAHKARLAEL
jgi:hypothetical protein